MPDGHSTTPDATGASTRTTATLAPTSPTRKADTCIMRKLIAFVILTLALALPASTLAVVQNGTVNETVPATVTSASMTIAPVGTLAYTRIAGTQTFTGAITFTLGGDWAVAGSTLKTGAPNGDGSSTILAADRGYSLVAGTGGLTAGSDVTFGGYAAALTLASRASGDTPAGTTVSMTSLVRGHSADVSRTGSQSFAWTVN